MVEYLYHLITRNKQGQEGRSAVGKFTGIVAICVNLLLSASKLVAGFLAGSVAVTADGLNNLSDTVSGVVTFIGFRLAERPADPDHPFGHARYEYISGLTVSALILVIGFQLLLSSGEKILNPVQTQFSGITFAVLGVSIAVKLGLYLFGRKMGRLIDSATVLATADDSRNDVITTSAVLAASAVTHFSGVEIDGWAGLAVSLFILVSGLSSAKETVDLLLGEAADPQMSRDIISELRGGEKVLGVHDLMIHDYGPGARFASAHVEMDAAEDPVECHEIIDGLERIIMEKYNVHLVIHYDPIVTGDAELDEMRNLIAGVLQSQDSRLSIHDFRRAGHFLVFDVDMPYELRGMEAEITKVTESAIAAHGRDYRVSITFDTV